MQYPITLPIYTLDRRVSDLPAAFIYPIGMAHILSCGMQI